MAIRESYEAVLADLRQQRQEAVSRLQSIEAAIAGLEWSIGERVSPLPHAASRESTATAVMRVAAGVPSPFKTRDVMRVLEAEGNPKANNYALIYGTLMNLSIRQQSEIRKGVDGFWLYRASVSEQGAPNRGSEAG